MYDIIRDSTLGQFARLVTKHKVLLYTDERPDFELPTPRQVGGKQLEDGDVAGNHLEASNTNQSDSSTTNNEPEENKGIEAGVEPEKTRIQQVPTSHDEIGFTLSKSISRPIHPVITSEGIILIDWYTTDDPSNPQNWSLGKKIYVVFVLSFYTFAVYIGSSIYAPGEQGVMDEFGVGNIAAALGLSLYVLAYGIGPMLWSPLSEIPAVGRTPPYIATFIVFVVLTIPSALTHSFAGLLVGRFLLGFFGSPCLATAGASFQDMFPLIKIPYLMIFWVGTATLGPALGPVIAGFSVQAKSWRWSQWEMLWLSGPVYILMLISLPETSAPTILLKRAQRLRKSLQKSNLKSQSEIDQANMSANQMAFDALIKPWEINALDPAVLFSTVYTSLLYGIFYSFFESTPLVYPKIYHFNLGEAGLPFLSALVAILIIAPIYAAYWHFFVERPFAKKGFGPQEDRLLVGLVGSCLIPIGLFLYAWSARGSVHWIAPTIGLGFSVGGTFLIVQSIFLYLPFTYPQYSASLFAANDLARSTMAAAAILFSRPLFVNLGIAGGVSLLGGLTLVCAFLLYLLYRFGARLRARSKFALK